MDIEFEKSALLLVDVQNDFLPGGALAVAEGDRVIEPLNRAVSLFQEKGGRVIATQDWHPVDHCSFEVNGGPWPPHCVAATKGADLSPSLKKGPINLIIRKGFREDLDSYSAFFENDHVTPTGLDGYLRGLELYNLFVGGLATDFCVLYSCLDACRLGYTVFLLKDASMGIDNPPGSIDNALATMREAGVSFIREKDL
jgi:nicotinamidase/pyrazinamidase